MFTAEIRLVPDRDTLASASDARREDRSPVVVPGRINELGARSLCRVADLSVSGARLHTHAPLTPGNSVMVTLPGQKPRPATIVWTEGFVAGCEFAVPLQEELLDLLVAMYRFAPVEPDEVARRN
ncbi:MAG: PilZ domain-containing protein [Sphingomonas sp.]|jgi:hypothetical protein|uniref:PilZ domain-containing protein n=1 Tax=Sphingomonas sp. TaxID=28214 RepID=UPI0035690A2F